MATITLNNISVGKSLQYNGSSVYTIYGKDFNPPYSEIPDLPSGWDENTQKASGETSYDLLGFQPGNEVCFCALTYTVDGAYNVHVKMRFQYKEGGSWYDAGWVDEYDNSWTSQSWYTASWWYVGIDYDEIRPGHSDWRFLVQLTPDGGSTYNFSSEFTTSSLVCDSTRHPAGYMWVRGTSLNFTDASWSSTQGFKHVINMDGTYPATFVGKDKAGHIWLSSNTNDKRIYYIDQNGYTRRTKPGQARGDENHDYAGTQYKGYMWVSNGRSMEQGYAHLCYVDASGYKRRIINGGI